MPPKRTKSAGGTKAASKRVKPPFTEDSDSDIEDTASRKAVSSIKYTLDEAEEEEEPLVRRNKNQSRPKPKKKTLPLTSSETKPNEHQPIATILSKQPSALKDSTNSSLKDQENMNLMHSKNSSKTATFSKDIKGNEKMSKKSSWSASSMSQEQMAQALEDLNIKYMRLKNLRETEAEKNLKECRVQLEEVTRSAELYRAQTEPQLESALRSQEKLRDNSEVANAKVRTLQRQVREYEELFRQREQADKIRAKTASMESVLASPDVAPSSVAAVSTVKIFENLTGFKMVPRDISPRSPKDKFPTTWDCEQSGRRGTLRFTLTYDYTNNVVSYTPSLDPKRDAELLKTLPDYLTDEIEFDRQFESKFFWRMLNFNNEDE
ncbi:hypothetical protein BGZ51_003894 [Haplosporangium sp. Z 767]|nr:hypothetical protein BGZ51_003894 [Haplosporangium sp. Z 767]KAF9187907.1 hypothetical protein BGZ50_001691 [Haplosporangium sp. Z 11]